MQNGEVGKEVEGKFHHWRDLETQCPTGEWMQVLSINKRYLGEMNLKMEEI